MVTCNLKKIPGSYHGTSAGAGSSKVPVQGKDCRLQVVSLTSQSIQSSSKTAGRNGFLLHIPNSHDVGMPAEMNRASHLHVYDLCVGFWIVVCFMLLTMWGLGSLSYCPFV
jgi:hypothetical protein